MTTPGIKQSLSRASTASEVRSLLNKLEGYREASPRTIRKCQRIAKAKLAEMEKP